MKFSFSAAAAAILPFFITLVFSNPLATTISLVVKEQITTTVLRREWGKGDIKCNTDRSGHTNWANTRHTRLNYEWLFKHGGQWKAKAGETGRIRCSESSAIYVINTTPNDFMVPYTDIASLAQDITQPCNIRTGRRSWKVNGERTDDRGFIVIISSASGCLCPQCDRQTL